MLIPPDVHAAGRDFIGIVRAAREFCRRLFVFWCWIARFGHSPLAGVAGMLCRRTARLQVRCAPGGGRGCGESGALARGGAASRRGCAVRLRPHRRLSLFPLNNSVFAPSQKHLMHLECIKRACYVRTRAAHVRRKIGWLLPVLCTSFVNIFKTLLLHVALLPEKW